MHPQVTLNLVAGVLTRDGVLQIERGSLDLAFVALPLDPSPTVRSRLIGREPMGVALPIDHPRTGDSTIDAVAWPAGLSRPRDCLGGGQ
jgi:DNA-binding transcriptional LysR family regulator